MIGSRDERTPPMTPQLALRVALIGGFALVMFAVIFFRLWFLQVLSGSQYVQAAQVNIVRDVPVPAQRGEIVDRNGTTLVDSQRVPAIQIAPDELPVHVTQADMVNQPALDYQLVYDKLARILRMSTKPHPCSFYTYGNGLPVHHSPQLAPIPCLIAQNVSQAEYANVTIKTDVSPDIQAYIAERSTLFPGVVSQEVYLRKYPLGDAGAQVFGTLGPISLAELNTKPYKGIKQGNIVGQSGLEYTYNSPLQGADGEERVKVNSNGQFEGYAKYRAPTAGDTLKLSLDAKLEQVGQQALQHSIALHGGSGGAFVALNPQNGSVYAMGSAPSFNPSVFTKPISDSQYKSLTDQASNDPLLNRAIGSTGATGSTFKVITATAALESGKWSVDQPYDDTGQFCFPGTVPPFCLHNSGHVANGAVSLVDALRVSDDVYFYHLGYILNGNPLDYPHGWPLQHWAHAFGIGRPTGVDLPGEASGTLPSPAWRAGRNALEVQCDKATGSYRYSSPNGSLHDSHKLAGDWHRSPTHAPGGCGIANLAGWTIGDNVNTAVGQGDDQVSPLQLAVAYSTLANGGTVVTPHIGMQIQSPAGTVLQNINPAPKRKLNINPAYRSAILDGLNEAAQSPGGTSDDVMGNFPMKVYGKTGTAQYGTAAQIASNTESDYAWYACFVPATATSKPIAVVVWVPKGGFGDVAAAPVARQILDQWFYGKPGPYVTGTSTTL